MKPRTFPAANRYIPKHAVVASNKSESNLLALVTNHYLKSGDFNGAPIRWLREQLALDDDTIKSKLTVHVQNQEVSLNFGDRHPNSHVKAFAAEDLSSQITKLKSSDLEHVCVYPETAVLKKVVRKAKYRDKPFQLELALGAPCLEYLYFDLSVLEPYRNDPRYYYENNDVGGRFGVEQQGALRERDDTNLKMFGFAYDSEFNRAVAVLLCDLADLTPEHQRIWAAKRLDGDFTVHPDFHRIVCGDWGLKLGIFDAFALELDHINKMLNIIGKEELFRTIPVEENRPNNFSFLLRPTSKEFHDFALTLDKLMSDNLRQDFFKAEGLSLEEEITRSDGKIEVKPKGTITLLSEWIAQNYRPKDPVPLQEMISTFREVRKLRQAPAHKLNNDVFDQEIFKQQRQLVIKAYGAVRTLRLILANHPKLKGYKVEDELYNAEIWTF